MKPIHRRALALILALALLTLSACRGTDSDGAVAMGRYIEEELSLPDGIAQVIGLDRLEDGSLWLTGMTPIYGEDGDASPALGIWVSRDFGDSWQLQDYLWYADITDLYTPNSAYVASPDEIYFLGSRYVYPDDYDGSGFFSGEIDITNYLHRADREGITELSGDAIFGFGDTYNSPREVRMTPSGQMLINYTRTIAQFGGPEGRQLHSYAIDRMAMWGSYLPLPDNRLAAVQNGKIAIYDLETGDLLEELAHSGAAVDTNIYTTVPGDMTVLALGPTDGALHYADASGIYRVLPDGNVTERLMDGELCSLGLPTIGPQYLFVDEESRFLMLCFTEDMSYKLYRYAYDPGIPTVPTHEIGVYSLEENQTVRQAIGRFQQANPDVRVTLQIGLTEDSGVTAADALRTLAAELLAGRGPDVLVLDGMPVDSYIDKGVLVDLEPLLGDFVRDELLLNIADAFREGGALYALPGRFSVPVAQTAPGVTLRGLDDLVALAEGGGAHGISPDALVDRLYPALAPHWFRGDGSLDADRFRSDLEKLGRIAAVNTPIYEDEEYGAQYNEDWGSLQNVALNLKGGSSKAGVGFMRSFNDIGPSCAVYDEGVAGPVELFPSGEGIFIPSTVLGISAAGQKQDLAAQFIRYALSEEVQGYDFYDGLPVNRAALEDNYEWAHGDTKAGLGSTTLNPETGEFDFVLIEYGWPNDAVIDRFLEAFESLTTPAPTGAVVKGIFVDETADFLLGNKPLEETVSSLRAKLDIYLSE